VRKNAEVDRKEKSESSAMSTADNEITRYKATRSMGRGFSSPELDFKKLKKRSKSVKKRKKGGRRELGETSASQKELYKKRHPD